MKVLKIKTEKNKYDQIERMESHIATLEQDLGLAKQEVENQKKKVQDTLTRQAAKRFEHYEGLMKFLSDLYKGLGGIQATILEHISKLNSLISESNDERISCTTKELRKNLESMSTLLLPHRGEERTSSKLMAELEDDE